MANEVAVAPTKDDSQLPAYLQGAGNVKNHDNFDSSDVVIPRIKLLQGISPEVEQFNEAKAGNYWHTGLDMSLGSEMKFVVVDRRKKYLLQAPIQDGQGILARADDAKTWDRTGKWQVKIKGVKNPVTWEISDLDVEESGMTKWGTSIPENEDSPPAATLFYDYLVFLPDHMDLGPAVISLARSQIKKAKKGLNDKISMHGNNGRPMQALVFVATVVEEQSEGQTYKNWAFRSGGFVQDEAQYKMFTEYRGALANLKIQDEGNMDEPEKDADDGEGSY
jgi:hypothetical protein